MSKIIETLRQSEWWYGQDGFPYRITEMELSHIVNTLRWLRRRAHTLRMQHHWDEFLEYSDLDDFDAGTETELAFVKWLGAQPTLDVEPKWWLDRTPLVQELRRELVARGAVDGDLVDVRYDKELEDDSDGIDGRAVESDSRLRNRTALG